MDKEFNAIEFLINLEEQALECATEEEVNLLYEKAMEGLTEEEALEVAKIIQEAEELEDEEQPIKTSVLLEVEHLLDTEINRDEFQKGIDDVARICGQFSALKSVGMSDKDAMEVITNLITIQINNDTIEGNVRVANLQDTLSRV